MDTVELKGRKPGVAGVCQALGALLPEGAIVSDEGNTSGLFAAGHTAPSRRGLPELANLRLLRPVPAAPAAKRGTDRAVPVPASGA